MVSIDFGEVDALNYAPELMLYNTCGEKISQLNLARKFNDVTNPNFIYQNQQFVRDYIRIDTLDFDPETGEELETLYLHKTHQFFNVSFNEDEFIDQKEKENQLNILASSGKEKELIEYKGSHDICEEALLIIKNKIIKKDPR